MQISGPRILALLALDIVVFAIAAFVLLQFMPKPLKAMDYFMVGGVATLISLLSVWLILLREMPNPGEFLYKKRARKLNEE
jgi:hypothetical protein